MKDLFSYILYKIIATSLVVFVINLMFLFVYRSVFDSWFFTVTIIKLSFFVALDKILQPSVVYRQEERTKKDFLQVFLLIIFLILNPLMLALPYLEYTYLMKNRLANEVLMFFWSMGLLVLIIGGITLSYSRYVLGKLGSPVIGIESDHKLVTTGPYRFVRHPIYVGAILLFLGFALSFSGIISSLLLIIFLVIIFLKRIHGEEKLLIATFGDEYLKYMNRTKRLIPFVY